MQIEMEDGGEDEMAGNGDEMHLMDSGDDEMEDNGGVKDAFCERRVLFL